MDFSIAYMCDPGCKAQDYYQVFKDVISKANTENWCFNICSLCTGFDDKVDKNNLKEPSCDSETYCPEGLE